MDRSQFPAVNLAPIWSLIEQVAMQRETQKRTWESSNLWRGSSSTHLPGLAGETAVALITGKPLDARLRLTGDDGTDIATVDVKTVTYWPPYLKHPVNAKRWPRWFALVYLDEPTKQAHFIGVVSADDLRNGERKTFNEKAGEQYVLSADRVASLYRAHLARKGNA